MLGDAVDIAATQKYLAAVHADHLMSGEKSL